MLSRALVELFYRLYFDQFRRIAFSKMTARPILAVQENLVEDSQAGLMDNQKKDNRLVDNQAGLMDNRAVEEDMSVLVVDILASLDI